jgi:cysteine desulfurase family protein (TIGR01976 family)
MAGAVKFDVEFARGHFPLLAGDWALFDNAAGTLVPESVIARTTAFLRECQVQPNNPYPASELATARLEEAKSQMAAMINAAPDEVVIGHSTTMNVYVLSKALRPLFREGDEIIVTNLDHESNNGAWRQLEETGITVREWRANPETADLEIEALDELLTERTRLVCFTHCSNVTGTINDVAAIVRRVHDAGAWVCVDAVAYAPHRRLDVKALDVDFYLCSLYKLYGPHHALMYGKRERFLAARGQSHFFIAEDRLPGKLTVGGHNYDVLGGLAGITDYLSVLHDHHFPRSNLGLHDRLGEVFSLVASHEERLARPLIEFLAAKPKVRLIGRATADATKRAPTISFAVEGRDSAAITAGLAEARIGASNGNFYAYRIVRDLGYGAEDGVVRTSMVHYNTEEEVRRLIARLDTII